MRPDLVHIYTLANDWTKEIEKALLKVENQRRHEIHTKPFPDETSVFLPTLTKEARIRLLTLKVWCKRYCITPEFILETLTLRYKSHRNCKPNEVRLGLPLSTITGPKARKIVEEEVKRSYPNNENFKVASLPPQVPPMRGLKYDSVDQMVARYSSVITARHAAQQSAERIHRRKFRKENKPSFEY